jgi:hypothetical protein
MSSSAGTDELIISELTHYLTDAAADAPAWQGKVTLPTRAQVLELAFDLSRPAAGHIVEFGVWKGGSTRVLRDELWRARLWDPRQWRKRIYACDSFEGLSQPYEGLSAGNFATPVPRLHSVRIVKGFFEDSLTPELAQEVGRVSLAHFDADLYESTSCALRWLTPLLGPGSLLLFDEFLGEDPAECRAFLEWSQQTGTASMLLGWFSRPPSGKGQSSDRRALFQVIGTQEHRPAPPLLPVRLRRRIAARW